MQFGNKLKVLLLFLGDIVALYAALFLTLLIRYGSAFYEQFVDVHFGPFTVIFIPWLLVFYIAGLYDLRRLRNNLDFLKTLALSLITSAAIAVLAFYLIPAFGITPKTNLLIFIVFFAIIEVWWRRTFNRMTAAGEAPNRVLLIGDSETAIEAEGAVAENPQLGYTIVAHPAEAEASQNGSELNKIVEEKNVNVIVVPRELKRRNKLALTLYAYFGRGIAVIDLDNFYEIVMRKIPLADVEETWFLENVEAAAQTYGKFKRVLEFLLALVIGVVLLPFEILIALLVVLTSRGPAIYRQTRVGLYGKHFTLYKFRTMHRDAERGGAQWAERDDTRVTLIGKFLRKSHLDELPQLWNIMRGNLSFVGPRPERPEFIEKLKTEIPFYEVRLLVRPGVTGWAQINHHADLTLGDVKEKLKYDVYYLKNRSLILDFTIILKTLKSTLVNPK
jgi:exopolysaccharide biosynthesis polyprenyl glycosylphosphotransferase